MNPEIIIEVVLFGIALAMDAFAVSVTDGLIYDDINKKRSFFIASTFGLLQGIMPLSSFLIIHFITKYLGEASGEKLSNIISIVIIYVSFILLLIIGIKMLLEGIKDIRSNEAKEPKHFSIKEVLIMGFATAVDAMAVGVSLNANISTINTIWLHVLIIAVITFIICLIGLFLGKLINKLFKGKYEATVIIGGAILILLGIWVLLSHYLNI